MWPLGTGRRFSELTHVVARINTSLPFTVKDAALHRYLSIHQLMAICLVSSSLCQDSTAANKGARFCVDVFSFVWDVYT